MNRMLAWSMSFSMTAMLISWHNSSKMILMIPRSVSVEILVDFIVFFSALSTMPWILRWIIIVKIFYRVFSSLWSSWPFSALTNSRPRRSGTSVLIVSHVLWMPSIILTNLWSLRWGLTNLRKRPTWQIPKFRIVCHLGIPIIRVFQRILISYPVYGIHIAFSSVVGVWKVWIILRIFVACLLKGLRISVSSVCSNPWLSVNIILWLIILFNWTLTILVRWISSSLFLFLLV